MTRPTCRPFLPAALLAVAVTMPCHAEGTHSIDEAFAASKRTGKPVLVLYGDTSYCAPCRKLNADLAKAPLKPLVDQVIELHIDTKDAAGKAAARQFGQLYRSTSNFIPQVYLIAADGKELYNGTRPANLADLLKEAIANSGKQLSEQDLDKLRESFARYEELAAAGDMPEALKELARYAASGSMQPEAARIDGAIAELGVKAREDFDAQLQATIDAEDDDARWTAAYGLAGTVWSYRTLPEVGKELAAEYNRASRKRLLRETLDRAEAMTVAMGLIQDGERRRGAIALRKVVQRHPETPAAELAGAELAKLGPEFAAAAEDADEDEAGGPQESTADDVRKAQSHLRMAKVFARGNKSRALEYCDKTIAAAPSSAYADQAKALKARLED